MASRLSLPTVLSWQPQTIPRLARNSLTENLLDAFIPFGNAMIAINRWGYDVLTQTANPTNAVNKWGNAVSYNGSTQYHSRTSAPEPLRTAQSSLKEVSMALIAEPTVIGATTEAIGYGSSTSANPLFMFGVGVTSGRAALRIRDTASTNVEIMETTGLMPVSELHLWVATRSEAQNKARIFRDGSLGYETTSGSAVGSVSFDRTCVGGLLRSSFALAYQAKINLAVAWSRALSLDEAHRFCANPWQIFEFPSRPLIINSAAQAAFIARSGLNISQAVNRASTF